MVRASSAVPESDPVTFISEILYRASIFICVSALFEFSFFFSILVECVHELHELHEHLPLTHSLGGDAVRFLLLSPLSVKLALRVELENGERARFLQ